MVFAEFFEIRGLVLEFVFFFKINFGIINSPKTKSQMAFYFYFILFRDMVLLCSAG